MGKKIFRRRAILIISYSFPNISFYLFLKFGSIIGQRIYIYDIELINFQEFLLNKYRILNEIINL